MKYDDDHHHCRRHHHHFLPFHQRIFWKISSIYLRTYKFSAYVILLILIYALGYITGLPFLSSNQLTPTISTVIATANKCPSVTSFSTYKTDIHNQFGPKCGDPIPPGRVRSTLLNRVYNDVSPYHEFPPAHLAHLLQPKNIRGWGSYSAIFEKLISKIQPRTIIEVGTFLGASAIHMAELTRKLGLDTQILCVDDFRGWPGFRALFKGMPMLNGDVLLMAQFLQNIVTLNVSELVFPLPFSRRIALQRLCEWGVMGDLIEVDAGHDFHSAWVDINLANKLLRPGGIMFGHDYFDGFDRKGVRRAVHLFAKVHGYNVSVEGEHWVIQ